MSRMSLVLNGANGHEVVLTEMTGERTAVEIEKMVSFLPFDIDQTVEFLKKIGIIK